MGVEGEGGREFVDLPACNARDRVATAFVDSFVEWNITWVTLSLCRSRTGPVGSEQIYYSYRTVVILLPY